MSETEEQKNIRRYARLHAAREIELAKQAGVSQKSMLQLVEKIYSRGLDIQRGI